MLGAAATAFYIKDYASFFPKTVMAKTSWYLMGATADLVEVKRHEDLSVGVTQSLLF